MTQAPLQSELLTTLLHEGQEAARERWIDFALASGAEAAAWLPDEYGRVRGEHPRLRGRWPASLEEALAALHVARPTPWDTATADLPPELRVVPLVPSILDPWEGGAVAFLATSATDVTHLEECAEFLSRLCQLLHRPSLEVRTATHDANGVIAAVLGHAFLLRQVAPPATRDVADLIVRELERACAILRETLTSRGSSPTDLADEFEVAELLRDVAELFAPRCALAGITLDVHPGDLTRVRLPAHAVRRCLENLVGNAIAALEPRRRGTVRLFGRRAADGIELGVEDDGPGIPAAVVGQVSRTGFTTRGPGHAGLGLAYVRLVADRHGGDLRITSHGPWTRVALCLPPGGARPRS